MSLSLKERRVVVKEIPVRYKKVKKKEKGKILDEFVKLTGYNRCYASYLLRTYEKKVVYCYHEEWTHLRDSDRIKIEVRYEHKNSSRPKGGICEQFAYFLNLAVYPNSSDINEIYRNSLRSFLYIGAAGFTLDILVRFAKFGLAV